jgi:PAS domain S-box-containing protein
VGIPVDLPTRLSPADVGFGRLFWRIHEAVIVGDASTGRIVLWNPAAARMFGYTEAEVIGMPIEMVVPDSHKQQHRVGLAHYSLTGTGPLIEGGMPLELPARRKDGTEFWVELSLSPLEDDTVNSRLVLAIVRDLTPRKLAESEHLERQRAETARAETEKRTVRN